MYRLLFLAFFLSLFSCHSKDDEDKAHDLKIALQLLDSKNIKLRLPSLGEGSEKDWVYGIKVITKIEGIEKTYAYGLFSDTTDIQLKPINKATEYRFQSTAIEKGTGTGLYRTMDPEKGIYKYYSPLEGYLDNKFYYSAEESAPLGFYPGSNSVLENNPTAGGEPSVETLFPELIRYYGETDLITLSPDSPKITLDLYNVSFGVNYTILKMEKGDTLKVELYSGDNLRLNNKTFVYPDTVQTFFYTLSGDDKVNHDYLKEVITPPSPVYKTKVPIKVTYIYNTGRISEVPFDFTAERNQTRNMNFTYGR